MIVQKYAVSICCDPSSYTSMKADVNLHNFKAHSKQAHHTGTRDRETDIPLNLGLLELCIWPPVPSAILASFFSSSLKLTTSFSSKIILSVPVCRHIYDTIQI